MPINKQLKITSEYFNNDNLQEIIYLYLIKMFKISNNNFEEYF